MYRTPYASLRVPDLDDTNQRQALINLATDIQYRTETNKSRTTELRRRRGVSVYHGGPTPLASAAVVTVPWSTVYWDPDGFFNASVSTTNVVVTRGLYLVSLNLSLSGGGALQTAYAYVNGSVYGNVTANQAGGFDYATTASLSMAGVFYTNGETLTASAYQRSSGAGNIYSTELTVTKIGSL